jgi:hypothetical protein
MSAVLVKNFKSLVLLLQLITVAQAFISKLAIGFHTILLFHITTIFFQVSSIPSLLNISIIHEGVQDTSQEVSQIISFHIFIG